MKILKIDLSSFPPEKQVELKEKILVLAWDDYVTVGHPELLTIVWDRKESIEKVIPEIAPYLTYQ